jgi:hypothetical protein
MRRDCEEQTSLGRTGASTSLLGRDEFVFEARWIMIARNITQDLQDWECERNTADEAREEAGYLRNQLTRLGNGKYLGNWVPKKGCTRKPGDIVGRHKDRNYRRNHRKRQVLRLLKLATNWLQERKTTRSDATLETHVRSKETRLLHQLTQTLERLMDYLKDLTPRR